MLRAAQGSDAAFAQELWGDPAHAMHFQPPEPGEAEALAKAGHLMIWAPSGAAEGFAALEVWDLPGRVFWLRALAVSTPGKGHGRAFLDALLAFLFGARDAHRLGLDVTADNPAALALYTRAGFVTEGRLRECWLRPDGAHADCHMLSLLRREWLVRNP